MCLSTSCIHLVSYVGFPPLASPQLLAFMLFQYTNFSCAPVPLSNFLHAFGFNTSASPVCQQLLALIWFQHLTSQGVQSPSPCDTLGFPPPSRSALFFSISTLHTSVPHLGAFTWLQYLNFPLVPLVNFLHSFAWSQDFTSGLLTTFCVQLNLVSMSKLPPCLSTTSCTHLVSISNFPPVPLIKLPKLPAFIGFQYLYFPRSLPITSCVRFVLISKLPPRCPITTSCIHLASIFPVPLSNFLHSFGLISGSTMAS